MKSYTFNDLDNMLKFFEVSEETALLLHSSLFNLGILKNIEIKNIPKELLNFFLSRLNNFNQPTFNYSFPKNRYIDLTLANSEVGLLSNEMLQRGFYRTIHPIFSFVGNNEKMIKPNFIDKNPFGKKSFFDRLTDKNGVIIVLGAKPSVATYIIYAEFMSNVNYRYLKPFLGKVKTKSKIYNNSFYHFVFPLSEEYNHNYCEFHKYLLNKGVSKEFEIGASKAYGFKVKEFLKEVKEFLKNNPFGLLNKKPKYYYIFNKKEIKIEKASK